MRSPAVGLGPMLCLLLVGRSLGGAELQLVPAVQQVGQYDILEFRIDGVGDYPDPFDPGVVDVAVRIGGGGQTSSVPAFLGQDYERKRVGGRDWFYPQGQPVWKARFAPVLPGPYTATAWLRESGGERSSPSIGFTCVTSTNAGFIRVARRDSRWLEFSSGQPFFPIGQNLAFIGSQQYVTLTRAEEIFGKMAAYGANYARVWTGCEDWALAIEARKSAWDRSWERRDAAVPMPDDPVRRCVALAAGATGVNPSHAVALRPGTKYAAGGWVRSEPGTSLRLEVNGVSFDLATAAAGAWASFRHEFTTGANDQWLSGMRVVRSGPGPAWLDRLSLQEAGGGPELLWEADVNRPRRGFYNPLDCFWLDELLASARRQGVYLQVCLLTRDLYMSALKDPVSSEYERAIADAKRLFRYAVARWGAFTSLAAWEYWNEMDPGLPTDRFYSELGHYLERVDINRHLRTTSTWGPSPKDCRHPQLDMADVHFYLRPADATRLSDEVEAVLDRAQWLREQAPHKPVHQGECGLADDQWRITDEMKRSRELVDFHNMLWASALSGTSGTALPWWWERLDERDHYAGYRSLSRFVADIPWLEGEVEPVTVLASEGRVRVVGLRSRGRAWIWFFHREAAWKHVVTAGRRPSVVSGATCDLGLWSGASARVRWWDTRLGTVLKTEFVDVDPGGTLVLRAPDFDRDVACTIGDRP